MDMYGYLMMVVWLLQKKKNSYKKLKLKKDKDGLYAINRFGYWIPMANAVITCYCAPKPEYGKYVIGFKDKDIYNCAKDNLYWEEYHYKHSTDDSVKFAIYRSNVEVFKDGQIKVDGKIETPLDYLYDPDINMFACIKPHILASRKGFINGYAVDIDELMRDAGYINGDDASFVSPQILHRDGDWKNFNSENLEWCDYEDERYKKYMRQMLDEMNKRLPELNPGVEIPNFMYK